MSACEVSFGCYVDIHLRMAISCQHIIRIADAAKKIGPDPEGHESIQSKHSHIVKGLQGTTSS